MVLVSGLLRKKNDGSLIGLCGLRKALWADHPLTPCTEIAWRQARESWGHGYMTEAAIASLGDGFQREKNKQDLFMDSTDQYTLTTAYATDRYAPGRRA